MQRLATTEKLAPLLAETREPRPVLSTAAADATPVDAAVFCPQRVPKNSAFLVQVCLYSPGAENNAAARAREADSEAERRGTYSLPLDVPRHTRVDMHLEMPGLEVEEANAFLIWRGSIAVIQFEVAVPATVTSDEVIGRVRFAVAGVPAGVLRFKVGLNKSSVPAEPIIARKVEAERYRRAFVSYSSKDRVEVLRRVQAFRIAGLSVFQDILDLEPGERWARELYREIDNCDVFLLFWSNAAAASEWVAKEIAYALERKGGSDEKPPAIQPVPIEGPPPPTPPEVLRHLHFNDALLAHIQAAAAATQPTE
ncbi:toll/interleukin-1 receptor domain-containing protein [Microvirga arabica]|uniref:Toll/interleukin-1 receptor domain-containing protein n=1 Tax=Microvirga arabica TaxID=1128671 RepID=A0ABV6Y705_9HYPH